MNIVDVGLAAVLLALGGIRFAQVWRAWADPAGSLSPSSVPSVILLLGGAVLEATQAWRPAGQSLLLTVATPAVAMATAILALILMLYGRPRILVPPQLREGGG